MRANLAKRVSCEEAQRERQENDSLGQQGRKIRHDKGQKGPVDSGQKGLIVADHHEDHGAADAGNDHGACGHDPDEKQDSGREKA